MIETVAGSGMRDVDVVKWAESTGSEGHVYGLPNWADNKVRRR